MKVTVKVTAAHIAKGRAEFHVGTATCSCPVALAIRELGFQHAVVGSEQMMLSDDHSEYILLPRRACAFIEEFDSQRPVKPFQFTLSLTPDQWKERTV